VSGYSNPGAPNINSIATNGIVYSKNFKIALLNFVEVTFKLISYKYQIVHQKLKLCFVLTEIELNFGKIKFFNIISIFLIKSVVKLTRNCQIRLVYDKHSN